MTEDDVLFELEQIFTKKIPGLKIETPLMNITVAELLEDKYIQNTMDDYKTDQHVLIFNMETECYWSFGNVFI